uniref:Secreted protein n=1 Tax=Achlya hypogyna TaxID=1202772 RepID=A0A0A7CNI2_ACHHY|nr:secreted protein [Achlya hypogyna]
MQLTSLALALALSVASVDAQLNINWLVKIVEDKLKKVEIPIINQFIDGEVQKSLVETAKIVRPPLTARQTGDVMSYKILQIPDMHYTGNRFFPCLNKPDDMKKLCFESYMNEMLDKMIDDINPDFVVFTGDQIESLWYPQSWLSSIDAIDTYSANVIKRKLPWAMVFGNHDEGIAPQIFANRKIMMAYIESLDYSYAKYGPFNIGGAGNYELTLRSPNNSSDMMHMYFADTRNDGDISLAQLDHLKTLSGAHKGQDIPALMFFHIPMPEYKEFNGTGQGDKREGIGGHANHSLYETITQNMGDVKATFCGHDHLNDFCFKKDNLHMCYGGGVGYGAGYNKGYHARTARVIEWSRSPTNESISTWLYRQNTVNTKEKYMIFERTFY